MNLDYLTDEPLFDLPIELKWKKGDRGEKGDKGDAGPQGPRGFPGKDGKNGRDGKDGLRGADGKDGKDGRNGKTGSAGKDGISAYESWLQLGNEGTEEEFIASLKGKDGKNGKDALWQGNAPKNLPLALDSDAISVRPTDFQDEVRIGRRPGVTGFTKFAYRDSLNAAAGEQVIWTASDNSFVPMESADTYDIAYDGTAGGSTDGAGTTGALTLAITHVNSDGNPETFVHTLGTDGSDTTTQSGFGINRVAVSSNGGATFNVSDITITDTTNGNTQAHVRAENSVTEQAIFVTGANHDAVAKWLWIQTNKLSGGGDVRSTIRGYVYNRNIDTRFLIFRAVVDTRAAPDINIIDPIGFNFSPTDVVWFTIDTDNSSAEVDLRFSLNEYQRN